MLSGTGSLADVGDYPLTIVATGQDGLSATQTFTVSLAPFVPPAPAELAATILSRAQVRLGWRDTGPYEHCFRLERRDQGGIWNVLADVRANTTTFTDTWANCNTPYDYRVTAIGPNGASAPSNTSSVTIADCTLVTPGARRPPRPPGCASTGAI